MNNDQIKKLAVATFRLGKIEPKVAKYVLSKLSRKELIEYLARLKKVVYENSVRVVSAEELSVKTVQSIRTKFKDKSVFFEQDKTLSEGIKIIIGDSVIDRSFSGYINNTLEQLKM